MFSVDPYIKGTVHAVEFQNRIIFEPLLIKTDAFFIDTRRILCRNIRWIHREQIQYICIMHLPVSPKLPYGRNIDGIPSLFCPRGFKSCRRKFRRVQIQKLPFSIQADPGERIFVESRPRLSSSDRRQLLILPSFLFSLCHLFLLLVCYNMPRQPDKTPAFTSVSI